MAGIDTDTSRWAQQGNGALPGPGPRLPAGSAIDPRQMWAANRFWMETQNLATKRYGGRRRQYHTALYMLMKGFEWCLERVGQYERGVLNAEKLAVTDIDACFPALPQAFDGFTILHLSDLHLDGMPGIEQRVLACIEGRSFDLCVLTGDYRNALHGPFDAVMASLRVLVEGVRAREGIVAVLGNHDDVQMVTPMETMGIRLLLNEHLVLRRGAQHVQIVGTDDVHYYYTSQALHALQVARDGFTIALVHSPELCDAAARAGVDLYLCGHTHAGQVCLPGGIPIIRHLSSGRGYYKGSWRHRGMIGVTSSGIGTSGIPVRFNTCAEVLCITLRQGQPK